MAWRAIQDTVGVSLSLAELTHLQERIWWRLLAHSDPWGRLDARPGKVRALCFPLLPQITDEEVGETLLALERADRIVVWEKTGRHTIQIVDFEQRQPREAFRKRPPTSDFPDPPSSLKPTEGLIEALYKLIPEPLRNPGGAHAETLLDAAHSGIDPDSIRNRSGHLPEERRGDGEETETGSTSSSSSTSRARADQIRAALDDDDDFKIIDLIRPTPDQRERMALASSDEPERFRAAVRAALDAGAKIAPYVDEILRNGSYPDEPVTRPTANATPTVHRCEDCDQTFDTWTEFDDHRQADHDGPPAPPPPEVAELLGKAQPNDIDDEPQPRAKDAA